LAKRPGDLRSGLFSDALHDTLSAPFLPVSGLRFNPSCAPILKAIRFHQRHLKIVDTGYDQNPVPPAPPPPKRRERLKQSRDRNLLDRFRDHSEGVLAFMRDFDVPFDNNLSERDLRMMKLRQKISGTFRSFAALVDFCHIRSYVSTARKNGLGALDALRRVFQGDPFLPPANNP
jgi:transposase